ncbi:MAG: hypothetical protein QOE31_3319, partial [Solirubrobacteraceae bacterium]|nr:hypothetical protein [Solirubrobacteraceae bacterium]
RAGTGGRDNHDTVVDDADGRVLWQSTVAQTRPVGRPATTRGASPSVSSLRPDGPALLGPAQPASCSRCCAQPRQAAVARPRHGRCHVVLALLAAPQAIVTRIRSARARDRRLSARASRRRRLSRAVPRPQRHADGRDPARALQTQLAIRDNTATQVATRPPTLRSTRWPGSRRRGLTETQRRGGACHPQGGTQGPASSA